MIDLSTRFRHACLEFIAGDAILAVHVNAVYKMVENFYNQPHRVHHDLNHLEYCFATLDRIPGLIYDRGRVIMALFFHDLIYDPRATDNEDRSADIFDSIFMPYIEASRIIRELIMATKTHELPARKSIQSAAKAVLDCDLAILGSDDATYDVFERAIRREYDFVSENDYQQGRIAVLSKFLARPQIFYIHGNEQQARSNLIRAIKALGG